MKLSFRRLHLRRRNALRCQRAIYCDLGSGTFLQQLLRARQREIGILQLGLGLGNRSLLDLDVGFERSPFQAIQKLSLLDVGAFRKVVSPVMV